MDVCVLAQPRREANAKIAGGRHRPEPRPMEVVAEIAVA